MALGHVFELARKNLEVTWVVNETAGHRDQMAEHCL